MKSKSYGSIHWLPCFRIRLSFQNWCHPLLHRHMSTINTLHQTLKPWPHSRSQVCISQTGSTFKRPTGEVQPSLSLYVRLELGNLCDLPHPFGLAVTEQKPCSHTDVFWLELELERHSGLLIGLYMVLQMEQHKTVWIHSVWICKQSKTAFSGDEIWIESHFIHSKKTHLTITR